jgi:hypothetical protein
MREIPFRDFWPQIRCVVFDFGFTLCPDYYFNLTPPNCPDWHEIIQRQIFGDPVLIDRWLEGSLNTVDIAQILARYIDLDPAEIVRYMELGCQNLRMNPAVWNFACEQNANGRKTALVTANMDVFTRVVVPYHHLDTVFDVILNTADFGELRKDHLWPIAFERLGEGIGYGNSFLIEDGNEAPRRFRELGGRAYQYSTDEEFLRWKEAVG